MPVQDGCLLRVNDYSDRSQAPKGSVEAQGCQGMALRVYHLVLFIPRSGNTPAPASAVWPRRGSQAAPARLHTFSSASHRASARYSPSNYSSVLSLQLSRFPGACMIARISVTFITCTAGAVSAAPPYNRRVPPPPPAWGVSGGVLSLGCWRMAAGGQRDGGRSITIFFPKLSLY